MTDANYKYPPGSLIFREAALFLTDTAGRELDDLTAENILAGADLETVEIEKEKLEFVKVIKSFLNLTSQEQDQYLLLYEGKHQRRTDVAVRTAFKSFPQSDYLPYNLCSRVCYTYKVNAFNNGIFPTLSKLNHSCYPNTEIFWNVETGTRDLVALTDISPGEELCHSYLQAGWSWADRRSDLSHRWGFTCYCQCCRQGQDLHVMDLVEQVNQTFHSHSGVVIKLTNILLDMEDLRLIRISKVLRVLDKIFLHYSIDSLLSSHYCDMLERVAALGAQYSHFLQGPGSALTRSWEHRVHHPTKNALNCMMKEMVVFLLRTSTLLILFHNFYENIVWQYLILLLSSLLYSKL